MPQSEVNPELEFTEESWLVSVIATGDVIERTFAGHAILVVEGYRDKIKTMGSISSLAGAMFNTGEEKNNNEEVEPFLGQYDIGLLSVQGIEQDSYINKKSVFCVIAREGQKSTRKPGTEYSKYLSRSYHVDPAKAIQMIDSIKDEAQIYQDFRENKREYPVEQFRYQFLGDNHFLSDLKMGHNCASWCIEKLLIAGIDQTSSKAKPKKLASRCAVM